MLRAGQSARLLARLQSVADAIDGHHCQSVISDALRLAARSFASQGTLTHGWMCSGRHTGNGGGHGTCHLNASFSLPIRCFASGGDDSGPDTRAYDQAMAEWNRMLAEEAEQGAEEGEVTCALFEHSSACFADCVGRSNSAKQTEICVFSSTYDAGCATQPNSMASSSSHTCLDAPVIGQAHYVQCRP